MKLRNKKTGEIKNVNHNHVLIHFNDGETKCINSLAELNEEWEDYKEDKIYWYIDVDGEIKSKEFGWFNQLQDDIGNRFETKEEAEKAVEKLKAWKRLKDKGFRFVWRSIRDLTITYSFYNYDKIDFPQMNKDLDLLFGGEE